MLSRVILLALTTELCKGLCPMLQSNGGSVRAAPHRRLSEGDTIAGKQTEVDAQAYFAALQVSSQSM